MSLGIETIHRRKINTSVLNGNTLVSIRHEGAINPNSTPANVGFSLDDNAGNKSSNYETIKPNFDTDVNTPSYSITADEDATYLAVVQIVAFETFSPITKNQ